MRKWFIWFNIIFTGMLIPKSVIADHFVTQSTANCRPLAMGGAFAAVNDNLAAFLYNPATFGQFQTPKDFRLTFYLNPLATGVGLAQLGRSAKLYDSARALGFLVKAITFTAGNLEGGFMFSEESLDNSQLNSRRTFFSSRGFWESFSHHFGLRLALAQQVAIGIVTTFYYAAAGEGERWGIGNRYGVLLKPDPKYAVGVFYSVFPAGFEKQREALERLLNDTIHIGLTYSPWKKTLLALDVRNINSETSRNSREIHLGAEQQVGSIFAMRAGYFQPNPDTNVFSGGIGLLADNLFFKKDCHFLPPHFMLDYTFLLEQKKSNDSMWHFFSCVLRF